MGGAGHEKGNIKWTILIGGERTQFEAEMKEKRNLWERTERSK
jgi:hypothetical protein